MTKNNNSKQLSAIVCVSVVVSEQQRKYASKSYCKLLDRLDRAIIAARDALPEYTLKEREQIKRMVLTFADRAFGDEKQHSVSYFSFLIGLLEERPITDENDQKIFKKLHRALLTCSNYWDRNLNKMQRYEEAEKWIKTWKLVA